MSNEADVEAISTDDAVLDEAKADEANKADEADAEANDTVEAIVTKEIEANVIDEIVAANEAIVIDKVIVVDEAILDNAANEAMWLMRPTRPMRLLLLMMPMVLSFTPSRKILQSLQK